MSAGPAEQLMNANQKVGYDVSSAEELRREHECVELHCVETYGKYAELLHKIKALDDAGVQQMDLVSQKEFMDFVCKSFALRLVAILEYTWCVIVIILEWRNAATSLSLLWGSLG